MLTEQYWRELVARMGPVTFKHGETLTQELAYCILMTGGIKPSTGRLVWNRLDNAGYWTLSANKSHYGWFEWGLNLDDALRSHGYRFPSRGATIGAAFKFAYENPSLNHLPDRAFRDAWLSIRGISYKTASLITRNWRNSDEVAVIDRLTVRALYLSGIQVSPHTYLEAERLFIEYANRVGVPVKLLDQAMVRNMRGELS